MSGELLSGVRVTALEGPYGSTCARFLGSLGAELHRLPLTAAVQAQTDVLLVSRSEPELLEAGISLAALRSAQPRLITASLTPFGGSGPHAGYRAGELVCSAMGGVLRLCGDADRPPVKEALDACTFHAEGALAAAILVAYCEREQSGLGQHVDVSIQEVAASRLTNALLLWQFDGRRLPRSGQELRYARAAVRCIWPLRDGHAFHTLMSGRFGAEANRALVAWMDELGLEHPFAGVDWLAYDRSALPADTRARWEEALAAFFCARSKHELRTEGRRRGIQAAVVQEPADVLADPQLAARAFFEPGERGPQRPQRFLRVQPGPQPTAADARGSRALRVLDLSWALVGSLTTKILADHGATVIKLESAGRPCLTRTDVQVARSARGNLDDKPWFAHLNTGKHGLALDLKHPRAREVLEPLIDWADVVVENFSPGTLDKLGLGYAALCARRPDLILASTSAHGQTGPLAHEWGVDGTSAALSGRLHLTGWPDRPPSLPGAVPYADAMVPQFMAAAILAAWVARRRSGRGCQLDVSMLELSVLQLEEALVALQLGAAPVRAGNHDPRVFHQGVYPARGHDRWIAISLFERADHARLVQQTGLSLPDPQSDRARFDRLLSAYTREREDFALMHALQAAGIAAGVVQDAADLLNDPDLRARPAWVMLEHPVLGAFEHQSTPFHLSRTRPDMRPAPLLGQHTCWICRSLLGLTEERYADLRSAGLFR